MTRARTTATAFALALVPALALAPASAWPQHRDHDRHDLGRQVLGERDGWAAAEGGTTGGADAGRVDVHVVRTWDELREALGEQDHADGTAPRIVYVKGTIDANPGGEGTTPDCSRYAVEGFSMEEYIEHYDPAVYEGDPAGELEEARAASQEVQQAQVRLDIPSDTTLVGLGDRARIVGANLRVADADDVVIRNVRLSDAYDCFPAWEPGDAGGTWNSEYDNLSLVGATHVWVDHVTFDDGDNPPDALPTVFDAPYEVHDGLLDITNGSSYVTVSWNEFVDHDKVMLIGSGDTNPDDPGNLKVTVHHNRFEGTGQRTPRVRFGQVHVYNNLYVNDDADLFSYNVGVGVESQTYAERNVFRLADGIDPGQVLNDFGGTQVEDHGTLVGALQGDLAPVDLVDAHNAYNAADPEVTQLDDEVGWEPEYFEAVHPATVVEEHVAAGAGVGVLHSRHR